MPWSTGPLGANEPEYFRAADFQQSTQMHFFTEGNNGNGPDGSWRDNRLFGTTGSNVGYELLFRSRAGKFFGQGNRRGRGHRKFDMLHDVKNLVERPGVINVDGCDAAAGAADDGAGKVWWWRYWRRSEFTDEVVASCRAVAKDECLATR